MKQLIGIVVAVVVGIVAYQLAFNATSGFMGGSTESKLQKIAADVNKTLPKQLDPITRCDRVEAGPGKEYAYIYTVNVKLTEDQKRQIKSTVSSQALAKPEMKPIFDAGVVVRYKYFDTSGAKVLDFAVQR